MTDDELLMTALYTSQNNDDESGEEIRRENGREKNKKNPTARTAKDDILELWLAKFLNTSLKMLRYKNPFIPNAYYVSKWHVTL